MDSIKEDMTMREAFVEKEEEYVEASEKYSQELQQHIREFTERMDQRNFTGERCWRN